MENPGDFVFKKIEKEIQKNGKAVCPNPECTESIISEEKEGRAGSTVLEYWCQNETCKFHKKRILNISVAKGLMEQITSSFGTLGKRAITGVVGVFLVIGATLGNYVPKWLGIADPPDVQVDQLRQENEKLVKEISALRSNPNPSGSSSTTNTDVAKKDLKIESLEKEVEQLKKMMAAVEVCQSDLIAKVEEAKSLMSRGELQYAQNIFKEIYTDARLKNSFLNPNNSDQKKRMVAQMADSYETKRFTYEYLKSDASFSFLLNFLDTFNVVGKKELYLGKAYYNLPHYLESDDAANKTAKELELEERHYQLTGLKYYLEGLRENPSLLNKPKDHPVKSAVDNLLVAYQIFQENFPQDTFTITQAYQEQGTDFFLNDWIKKVDYWIKNPPSAN